jgi:hypothetical protein
VEAGFYGLAVALLLTEQGRRLTALTADRSPSSLFTFMKNFNLHLASLFHQQN